MSLQGGPVLRSLDDCEVSEREDAALRKLLFTCFPHEACFEQQRHYREQPQRRWLIEAGETLLAHAAIHEKYIFSENEKYKIWGLAEVCVHPSARGQGWVRKLLKAVENEAREVLAVVLLGDPRIYGSSGYESVQNLAFPDWKGSETPSVMVKEMPGYQWPEGALKIAGPLF